MANMEHRSMLLQGIETWNAWREEHAQEKIDLSGISFSEWNFRGRNFRGADLSNARFDEVCFIQANFRDATLDGAHLFDVDLSEADLSQAHLWDARLNGSNLRKTNLRNAWLSKANLSGTNLQEADLSRAYLSQAIIGRADLTRADLSGADLSEADLRNTQLIRANLCGANLCGANLRGTNLSGADLSGADLRETNLIDTRLNAITTRSIRVHLSMADFPWKEYPIELGQNSHDESIKALAEQILKKANLEDIEDKVNGTILTDARLWGSQRIGWSIQGVICEAAYWDRNGQDRTLYSPFEFERLYADKVKTMSHAFISYVRENSEVIQKLANKLEANGVRVWLDRNEIKPGFRWQNAIKDAIQKGTVFIACFSQEYHQRSKTYMNEELTLAIDELRQGPTDRAWFIPVLLSGGEVPDRSIGGGETLRSIQWVSLSEKDWDTGILKIISVVKSI